MEIRKLAPPDIAQAKKIWKVCFDDSDEFLDEYFDSVADLDKALGFFDNGKLLSDLFMLDFYATVSGVTYQSAFLAGCATLPEARKRYLMKTLIKEAFLSVRKRGMGVSFLHPFLHSFYRKFGYETVAYIKRYENTTERSAVAHEVILVEHAEQLPASVLGKAYDRYVKEFDNHFTRNRERFLTWLNLLFADGGRMVYIEDGDDSAYALYYENDGHADIFELVYFTDGQLRSLINSCNVPESRFFLPLRPTDLYDEAEEFTMMRVLDPAMMLKQYHYSENTEFVINIHDAFMERDYNLLVRAAQNGANVRDTDAGSDIITDIGGLARLMTGTYDPRIATDAVGIFKQGRSCYFETY